MRALACTLALLSTAATAGEYRVVGGNTADLGEWPDAVAVEVQGSWGCTGTLVAPRVVFTAGHCNSNVDSVLVGSNDYADSSQGEVINVIASYEYPNSWSTYDFAVLVLERDASVAPRPVATQCVNDAHLYDGAPVAIVGFGSTSTSGWGGNSLLMEAHSTVVDDDCSDTNRGCNESVSPAGEILAGGGGIDSCNGDSGGPLYLDTPDGYFLIGITSRAAYPANNNCGDGGIYVRADAVIDWAEQQTGLAIARPDCDSISPPANRAPAPTAGSITVDPGQTGQTTVLPNDPDAADSHSFAISAAPAQGTATVSAAGVVSYTAPSDFAGQTSLSVLVTDDGDPAEDGIVTVDITVREPTGEDTGDPEDTGAVDTGTADTDAGDTAQVRLGRGGCSCDTPAGGAAWLALLPLPLLLRRRGQRSG